MSYTKEDIKNFVYNNILNDILKNDKVNKYLEDDKNKFEEWLNKYENDQNILQTEYNNFKMKEIYTSINITPFTGDYTDRSTTPSTTLNFTEKDKKKMELFLDVVKAIIDKSNKENQGYIAYNINLELFTFDDNISLNFKEDYNEKKENITKNNEYIDDNKDIVKEQHEKLKNNKYIYYLITLFIIIILSIIVYIKQEFIIYYIVLFLLLNIIFKWLLIEHFNEKNEFYKKLYTYMKRKNRKIESIASDSLKNRLELGIKKEDDKYKNNKSELYNEYYKNRDLISIYGLDIITIKSLINLVMMITIILVLYPYITKYINKKMKINIDKNTENMILGVLISLVILVYMFDINYPIRTMSKNRYW
jgi:hypothetical protein